MMEDKKGKAIHLDIWDSEPNKKKSVAKDDFLEEAPTDSVEKESISLKYISEETMQECVEIVSDEIDVSIKKEHLYYILKNDYGLEKDIEDIGPDDTDVKGRLFDAISMHFLKCNWPMQGDKVNHLEFISRLNNAIRDFYN